MTRKTFHEELAELETSTAKMGEHLLAGLQNAADSSKGFVSNVRGRGMMAAFDVPDSAQRDALLERMKENGVYALSCGPRSVRFRGMLDTPAEVIDKTVEILAKSLPKA